MKRGRKARNNLGSESFSDAEVFHIVEAYLNRGEKPVQQVFNDLNLAGLKTGFGQIGSLLTLAAHKKMIRLCVPVNQDLQTKLVSHFPGLRKDEITVVDTPPRSPDRVSSAAANYVFEKIQALSNVAKEPAIGLGLGPGSATLDFCGYLGERLELAAPSKKLRLFAISAGSLPTSPHEAPVSFFNLFPENTIDCRVGLFAELLVRAKDFQEIQTHIGVAEAFARKGEIQIVVSSMGDFNDEHDLLKRFLESTSPQHSIPATWKGNVQFRPYTDDQPIKELEEDPETWRAVTLFELNELRRLADSKDKHVVLIARQSKATGSTKHNALRPLLTSSNLKVFNHLVTDSATASALLSL